MNPNCFGTGSENVQGCKCRVLYDNLVLAKKKKV